MKGVYLGTQNPMTRSSNAAVFKSCRTAVQPTLTCRTRIFLALFCEAKLPVHVQMEAQDSLISRGVAVMVREDN